MIGSIREAVLSAKILLMTPIPGASGYAWGLSRGCSGSAAMYRHIIAHTAERMIAEFGSRENEGIYIFTDTKMIRGKRTSTASTLFL